MCRDEKEKNPGLNRDQVSTAKAQVSRGCSATPLAGRRETAVATATTAGTDPPAPGEPRGGNARTPLASAASRLGRSRSLSPNPEVGWSPLLPGRSPRSRGTGLVKAAKSCGKTSVAHSKGTWRGQSRAGSCGHTGPGRAGARGAEVGRGGPRGGVRGNKPPTQALDPPERLSEIARKGDVDAALRAPGLVRAALAPDCRQRTQRGSGFPSVAQRAGAQVTRPPRPGPRGSTLPRREPAPGLRAKFPSPATSLAPAPQAEPGARRRGPGSPSSSVAAYLAPRGRRGAHPPSGRGSVRCAAARSGRARGGGAGGVKCAGTVPAAPRQLPRFGTSRRLQPRSHPRPLPGDPRGTKGSLYQNCCDITRRPGWRIGGAGPGAGGGAGGGGSAAWNPSRRGRGPGNPAS